MAEIAELIEFTPKTQQRNGYVLGRYRGLEYIGVRFGDKWKPARMANDADRKYFSALRARSHSMGE